MIYFLKYFKGIAYFLAMLVLFQSCVIYKRKPTTIENAVTEKNQHIKIITKDGKKYKVRWIEQRGENIYSITNTKRVKIKKKQLGAMNTKHELFNIENRGEYIRGLEMIGSKDTVTVIIPIKQVETIKLPNKELSVLVPFASLALVMGLFVGGMFLLLDGESFY